MMTPLSISSRCISIHGIQDRSRGETGVGRGKDYTPEYPVKAQTRQENRSECSTQRSMRSLEVQT